MDPPPLTSWQSPRRRVAGQGRDSLLSLGAQAPSLDSLCGRPRGCRKLLTAEVAEGGEGNRQEVLQEEGCGVRASFPAFCDHSLVGGREQVRNASIYSVIGCIDSRFTRFQTHPLVPGPLGSMKERGGSSWSRHRLPAREGFQACQQGQHLSYQECDLL